MSTVYITMKQFLKAFKYCLTGCTSSMCMQGWKNTATIFQSKVILKATNSCEYRFDIKDI